MKKQIVFTLATAALLMGATTTSANATVTKAGDYAVSIHIGTAEFCRANTLSQGGANSDIKGQFTASNGGACQAWLERKRYNDDGSLQYNWTKISDYYFLQSGDQRETGWHWNGANTGSRVCVILTSTSEKGCSNGIW
ncbi:hypothetical protein [Streptomyces sp. SAS_270]|uniref:hypothetical protein n=1 Tax=Streptomyces sp. SAS_270 TaxID=3412748 RepID=UPI00403C6358